MIIAPLAVGGLISGDPVGVGFGAAMGLSSALLLTSGFRSIRQGLAAAREDQRLNTQVQEADGAGARGGELLAAWSVSPAEWAAWRRADRRGRLPVAAGLWLGMALFGGPALAAARGVPIGFAVAFAAAFGLVVAILWLMWITRAHYQAAPRIRIGHRTLWVGSTQHTLRSDLHRLDRVWLEAGPPQVLVFKVCWQARRGEQADEVRVPVPAGAEDEALRVCRHFAGSPG